MRPQLATKVTQADRGAIGGAVACLARGGLVAFPTETVYGLGADATNGEAIARLYAAKGRPSFNPLIAHVADIVEAEQCAVFDASAKQLAAAFWPGPLTLVLPKRPGCAVAELATAGLDTIALRVPDHHVAQDILEAFGKPIVAPSANRSGHISPTTAGHVLADLGGCIDLIVNGGPTSVGVESTIIACLGGRVVMLRPGGVARQAIERMLGRALDPDTEGVAAESPESTAPVAPGMLSSHYAPRTPVRLSATCIHRSEALLAFGETLVPGAEEAAAVLNLSERGDVVEAAANLFAHLRALDRSGARCIAVMPVPNEGLGEAINDRLRRAAVEP